MLTNGHTEARKLRSRLNHPIIDADGHWAEFAPLMREEFRRIGGDTAVEALALASQRIPTSLGDVRGRAAAPPDRPGSVLVPADQEHARPGDGHAAAPHVRAPRRPRSRLLRGLPHGGTRLLPPAAGAAAPGPLPRVQRVHGRAVPPVQRPHHPRRDHPDVFAGGGDRGAGVRVEAARLQGRHDGRPHPPPHPRAGRGASRGLAVRRVVRRDRHRQRARLRSGVGRRAASCASRRASTTAPARSCSATHRRTSATTTSATSPRPARPWPRPSSSAASPGASRS